MLYVVIARWQMADADGRTRQYLILGVPLGNINELPFPIHSERESIVHSPHFKWRTLRTAHTGYTSYIER